MAALFSLPLWGAISLPLWGPLITLATIGCGKVISAPAPAVAPSLKTTGASHAAPPDDDPARVELREAIDAAAGYLVRACRPEGRFSYRVYLDGSDAADDYNIVRHAGAMYALAEYHRRWADTAIAGCLERAARHLAEHVAEEQGWSAIFSTRDHEEAKLGATGLGLAAWATMARSQRVEVAHSLSPPVGPLRALGAFVRFMQHDDGRFVSKYFVGRGRDESWTSLYYPGEAALGVILLSDLAPGEGWEETGDRALSYLHQLRRDDPSPPLDHWALLATRALHARRDRIPFREELRDHARQICRSMLRANARPPQGAPYFGCFTGDGRTTPTATRLEGLMAALAVLDPRQDAELLAHMRADIADGIAFLLRSQRRGGEHDGAVPKATSEAGAHEVRIDYVQHALSAWMDHLDVLADAQPNIPGKLTK